MGGDHYSTRTEEACVARVKSPTLFYDKRRPQARAARKALLSPRSRSVVSIEALWTTDAWSGVVLGFSWLNPTYQTHRGAGLERGRPSRCVTAPPLRLQALEICGQY